MQIILDHLRRMSGSQSCLPTERTPHYGLRGKRDYDIPFCKTERSSNTYFTNVLHEWNKLDENVINSVTIAEFKRKLLTVIRPLKKSLFGVFDIDGVKQLIMLRLEFSTLNEHKFRHNFSVQVRCVLAILESKIMRTSSCTALCLFLCAMISLANFHTFQDWI